MAWHDDQKQLCSRQRRWGRRRGGSLVIEAVIAAALLATATYGLTQLAKSAAVLRQQSDQRLAATLAAENTLERLRGVPLAELTGQADEVAEIVAASSGCEVDVSTTPFTAAARDGIHLRVDVSPSQNIRVTLHDWRLPTAESAAAEKTEADDDSEQPAVSPSPSASEVDDA